MRTMCTDWRGVPDTSKIADWYSVYNTAIERPVLGNHGGRVLVAWQPMVLFDGLVPADRPYNMDLYAYAMKYHAMTDLVVWQGEGGWNTRLVDITKRNMVQGMLAMIAKHFGWADGSHLDYFTNMAWQFPELAPLNDTWDRCLSGLAQGIRAQGKIALGQQFAVTSPAMALNGEFWEINPTSFGQTFDSHATDLANFRALMAKADPTREIVFVQEIREPWRYPQWYLDKTRQWATENNIVVSCGRDSTAGTSL